MKCHGLGCFLLGLLAGLLAAYLLCGIVVALLFDLADDAPPPLLQRLQDAALAVVVGPVIVFGLLWSSGRRTTRSTP